MLSERSLKASRGEASSLPSDMSSLSLEKGDAPALFHMFHNKLPESNEQAKSCRCLWLRVFGFAAWKQTAFCSLSCFSTVTLGAGRDWRQGPIPHAPLSPMTLSGLIGGALDANEGNTCLQETVSLWGNVEIRAIKSLNANYKVRAVSGFWSSFSWSLSHGLAEAKTRCRTAPTKCEILPLLLRC